MADDKKKKPDVVEDGGIKCKVPGLNKLFSSCASGEKTTSEQPAQERNRAADFVNDGGIGSGGAERAAQTLMNGEQRRQAAILAAGG